MKFYEIGINDKNYETCMNMLNNELAPVITECEQLTREISGYMSFNWQHCEIRKPYNKNEELKKEKFDSLFAEFNSVYAKLPVSKMGFDGGIEYYFNNVKAIKKFVDTFKPKFEEYRNNFRNPEIAPQFDI